MLEEFADGVLALGNRSQVGRRLGQPEREQAGPRGSLRTIDGLEQRPFA